VSFFNRSRPTPPESDQTLTTGLSKSRNILRGLSSLFGGNTTIDEGYFEELSDQLLSADVGVAATELLVKHVRQLARNDRSANSKHLLAVVREQMLNILRRCGDLPLRDAKPYVLLAVGVNGVGKTTTVAKIAGAMKNNGDRVLLAAADTFRAAAVDQLKEWGKRLDIPVVAQGSGADAAAVAHDAYTSALAGGADYLLIDTAGRQHTQKDLMAQLSKIKRVLAKIDASSPHEIMQVLDAGTGQNALSQLRHFDQAIGVDTLTITKLDGTAKGGVVLALAAEIPKPVRFVGLGERPEDLKQFDPVKFIDALLPPQNDQ